MILTFWWWGAHVRPTHRQTCPAHPALRSTDGGAPLAPTLADCITAVSL